MHFIKIGEKADTKKLFELDSELRKIASIRNEKRDIYPINLEEEKDKFIKAWKKGEKYNPQFKYDSIDYTKIDLLDRLDKLRKEFDLFDHEFSRYYQGLIEFYHYWITVFSCDKERSSHRFADSLFQIYGKADHRALQLSKEILKTRKRVHIPESEKQFDGEYLIKKFNEKMIDELGIDPWKCEFKEIPGRIGLSTPERKIYINKKSRFAEGDINSLLSHEIGVHVYRAQTGYDLGLFAFTIGSFNNESTEEGMAIRNSLAVKNTKPNILFEASINCFIASIVDTTDFHGVVENLMEYDDDLVWSFKKACRVKRSLEDTSIYGGFSRDQVYMKGYSIVKELDEKTFKEDLFKYRLAYDELGYIPSLNRIKQIKSII